MRVIWQLNVHVETAEVLAISYVCIFKQWVLDSECSYHMSPNRKLFAELSDVMNEKFTWVTKMHVMCYE